MQKSYLSFSLVIISIKYDIIDDIKISSFSFIIVINLYESFIAIYFFASTKFFFYYFIYLIFFCKTNEPFFHHSSSYALKDKLLKKIILNLWLILSSLRICVNISHLLNQVKNLYYFFLYIYFAFIFFTISPYFCINFLVFIYEFVDLRFLLQVFLFIIYLKKIFFLWFFILWIIKMMMTRCRK